MYLRILCLLFVFEESSDLNGKHGPLGLSEHLFTKLWIWHAYLMFILRLTELPWMGHSIEFCSNGASQLHRTLLLFLNILLLRFMLVDIYETRSLILCYNYRILLYMYICIFIIMSIFSWFHFFASAANSFSKNGFKHVILYIFVIFFRLNKQI